MDAGSHRASQGTHPYTTGNQTGSMRSRAERYSPELDSSCSEASAVALSGAKSKTLSSPVSIITDHTASRVPAIFRRAP